MIVRRLPVLPVLAFLALALAPAGASAQTLIMMSPGVRTEMTPAAREAHNGVFDRIKRGLGLGPRKATVSVGEVQTVTRLTPEDVAGGYSPKAMPYSTDPPPADGAGGDSRPAEAASPERVDRTPEPAGRRGSNR